MAASFHPQIHNVKLHDLHASTDHKLCAEAEEEPFRTGLASFAARSIRVQLIKLASADPMYPLSPKQHYGRNTVYLLSS